MKFWNNPAGSRHSVTANAAAATPAVAVPPIPRSSAPRGTIQPLDLADLIGPGQIIPELRARNRWEAIDELIAVLAATGRIEASAAADIADILKLRDRGMSTGIGLGLAFPEGWLPCSKLVLALGRSSTGVEFEALDDQPVHLVLLQILPLQLDRDVITKTVVTLAILFRHNPFREAVMKAQDAEGIYQVMLAGWKEASVPGFKRDPTKPIIPFSDFLRSKPSHS